MALFASPSRDLLFTNTHKRRLEKQDFLFFKEKKPEEEEGWHTAAGFNVELF
jgi:hypothetical protein